MERAALVPDRNAVILVFTRTELPAKEKTNQSYTNQEDLQEEIQPFVVS